MSRPTRRRWWDKFAEAANGVRLAVLRESSFRAHIAAAISVIGAAALLRCDRIEWCLLVGCIGAVLAAEVFNASVETLFHALDEPTKARMTACLDRAAGAVLLVSATAVVVGALIFGPKLAANVGW